MVDMDRFAAQVASLDAVISTSNTIAHLAGALGTPSVVILNDNFYQFWPFFGARTPWNPRTVLVRKNGRDWPSVMREAQASLASILSGQKAN
jgi:ADP-heptose:LPS heptosyltransferase